MNVDTGAFPLVSLQEKGSKLIQVRTPTLFWFAIGCLVCGVLTIFLPWLDIFARSAVAFFFIGGGVINLSLLPFLDRFITHCIVDRDAKTFELSSGDDSLIVDFEQIQYLEIISQQRSHQTHYQLICAIQTDNDELLRKVIFSTDNKHRLERIANRYAEFIQRPLRNACDD